MAGRPPTTPSKGAQRNVRHGVPSPAANFGSPTPKEIGMFDLDDFIASARNKNVTSTFKGDDGKKYDKAVTDLENSIKAKQKNMFNRAEGEVSKLLNTKNSDSKIRKLLVRFNELTAIVNKTKTRGGDWFQYITFKKDSRETPVATDFPTDSESVPKIEQTDVSGKLLAIEKILKDTLGEEKGTRKKKSDDRTTEDVLESIERLCTSAVKDRARAESTDIKNEALAKRYLQVAKEWITKFEKQMKEISQKEDEFKHSLQQSNDLDEIRAILNRLIKETKEREDDRKSHEEKNKKLAKELLSLITDKNNKTGNSKKEESNKENDIEQLLLSSISELNTQIDKLTNQASRLHDVTKSLDTTNGALVADKKTASSKKSQGRQGKSLPAIIETELQQLEDECYRNYNIVKQIDNEIGRLEKDIEDWGKSENVRELNDIGKCSLKALRSARINLQIHNREKVQKGKQGDVKKLNERIEKLCKTYGIADSKEKKDKHEDMLEQLDDRLKTEKEKLKTLEKELNELHGFKTTKNNTEINTLITLAQTAKTNQERLKKDNESEQKSKLAVEKDLKDLKEDIHQLHSSIPNAFRKTDQPSSNVMLEEMRESISRQSLDLQSSADEMKELQIALHAMGKDVLELSGEHVDSLLSSAQETQSLLNKAQIIQKQLKKATEIHSRLNQSLRENNDSMQRFSKQIEPHLDLVINTLTNKPQDGQNSQENCPECPQILMPIFVKVLRIKCISEQSLASLHHIFEIIIGREFQNKAGSNTKGYIDIVEILVEAVTSKGITGANVGMLEAKLQKMDASQQEVLKLREKITHWKAEAKREENEKLEYMNRLSKVASAKLMDNNPNIADLSDPNRQTKLAEEYSQLYDDEWTNAYEDREEKQPKESEENRINHLLEILTTVYSTCANLRTQQLTGMKTAILQPAQFFCLLNERPTTEANGNANKKKEDVKETNKKKTTKSPKPAQSKPAPDATKNDSEDVTLGILQSQAITDLGKQTSTQALLDITKYFQSSQESWFNSRNLGKYTTKCIEICWLMNIHSPPVCLDDDVPVGTRFDKTKYREYTTRGKKVKFVVWPAILLHENGPTLGKGVAQGMG